MYGQAFSSPAAVTHMNHFLPFGRKNLADAFAKSIFPCNLMVLLLKGGMTKIESERSAAWFSAFDWGSKGREFESLRSDHLKTAIPTSCGLIFHLFQAFHLLSTIVMNRARHQTTRLKICSPTSLLSYILAES